MHINSALRNARSPPFPFNSLKKKLFIAVIIFKNLLALPAPHLLLFLSPQTNRKSLAEYFSIHFILPLLLQMSPFFSSSGSFVRPSASRPSFCSNRRKRKSKMRRIKCLIQHPFRCRDRGLKIKGMEMSRDCAEAVITKLVPNSNEDFLSLSPHFSFTQWMRDLRGMVLGPRQQQVTNNNPYRKS